MRLQILGIVLSMIVVSCANERSEQKQSDTPTPAPSVGPKTMPSGMVKIPGGQFLMGGKSEQADQDEFPRHTVTVSPFLMDATEVTNQEFKKFVEATGYITMAERAVDWEELSKQVPPGTPKPADSLLAPGSLVFTPTAGPVDLNNVSAWWQWTIGANWQHPQGPGSSIEEIMDHPVVHVCYDDAVAYAKWARKRLPTEAEWEWASMGGLDDPKYPWGNESIKASADKANFWQGVFPFKNLEADGFYLTAPVKSFTANGYGLYDMAGNVWEWCHDKYHAEGYQEANRQTDVDPQGPEFSFDPYERHAEKFVVRGGSYLCNDTYCSGYRVARRMRSSRDTGLSHTGFRCVRDLSN